MSGALRQFTARKPAATGGFSPDDLAGLELWLDADDPATITDTAGNVSQWDDKSGNLRHVSRTPDSGVQTGVATLNSRNVITHNGASDAYLAGGTASFPRAGLSATWFTVWNMGADANYMHVSTNSDSAAYLGAASSGSTSTTLFNGFSGGSLFVDGAPFSGNRDDLHTATSSTAAIFAAVGLTSPSPSYYVTSWKGGADFHNLGGLAEVLCYAGALSTADQQSVETYLADKWGITL